MSSLEVSHYCDLGHALWDWRTGVGFQTWCFCTTLSSQLWGPPSILFNVSGSLSLGMKWLRD